MSTPCPLCARPLIENGTQGLSCEVGHAFTRDYFSVRPQVRKIAGHHVTVRPWIPGALLGALALLVELLEVVI